MCPPQNSIQPQETFSCPVMLHSSNALHKSLSTPFSESKIVLCDLLVSPVLLIIFPSCSGVLEDVESGLMVRLGRGDDPPQVLLSGEIEALGLGARD